MRVSHSADVSLSCFGERTREVCGHTIGRRVALAVGESAVWPLVRSKIQCSREPL